MECRSIAAPKHCFLRNFKVKHTRLIIELVEHKSECEHRNHLFFATNLRRLEILNDNMPHLIRRSTIRDVILRRHFQRRY